MHNEPGKRESENGSRLQEQATRDPETGLQRVILDTARQLLTSVGYAQVSMRKIANKIGYSATSIYLYYGNKDELVHALIDEGVEILHEQLKQADSSGSDPSDRLQKLLLAYIHFGLERPEYYEIMYVLHPEYIKRYPAEKYRKARRNLELIAAAIQDGMEAGTFREADPMLLANLAWAQVHGVVTLLNSERVDKRVSRDALIDASCAQIVRSMMVSPVTQEV
jgi:AcrR family transcriptional regulator